MINYRPYLKQIEFFVREGNLNFYPGAWPVKPRNKTMDSSGLIFAIIKDIAIPELAKFIKERYESTGTWPSKEEMDAKVDMLANDIISKGESFLNRKD